MSHSPNSQQTVDNFVKIVVLCGIVQESLMPQKIPHKLTIHGDVRTDDYFWMNQRDSEGVLQFLKEENERVAKALASTEALQEKIYQEMASRILENEDSVLTPRGNYEYGLRFKKGAQYPIYYRVDRQNKTEELLVDVNQRASGHSYMSFMGPWISPDQEFMAYGEDTVGRRFFDISFQNIRSMQFLPYKIMGVAEQLAWSLDNQFVFYVGKDEQTLREHQIWRLSLQTGEKTLIYQEEDETFSVSVAASKDRKTLFIHSHSTMSDECRYLSAADPQGEWRLFLPRERGHEYSIYDGGEVFFILSNWKAKNFQVYSCLKNRTSRDEWSVFVPHQENVLIEGLDVFEKFIVLEEREKGLTQLRVMDRQSKKAHALGFDDDVYVVSPWFMPEYESERFRFVFESPRTPKTYFEEHYSTQERKVLKRQEVPNYNREKYWTKRLWAKGHDGTLIPISLLGSHQYPKSPDQPCLLYGYGSYGISMDPYFSSTVFSLVDRGFLYAVAHIRGGSEMGRHWYEDGKLLKKKNTFLDFISSAEFLIQEAYTSPQHLHAMGGSAGGLLMGSVVNMRPDLFKGIVSAVPFVDVITTMLDDSIPLTTSEYDEWGNPNNKEYYDYMKSYSPYDNLEKKSYPNILVTTGYHDSQVQYWEPAKWVAKLRELKTDSNLLLFQTDMTSGHFGASGRYGRLKLSSLHYGFLLHLEGIKG